MDDDIDGQPMSSDSPHRDKNSSSMPAGFVSSRWETVDPAQLEAQAMTTSKWDLLEQQNQVEGDTDEEENESNISIQQPQQLTPQQPQPPPHHHHHHRKHGDSEDEEPENNEGTTGGEDSQEGDYQNFR